MPIRRYCGTSRRSEREKCGNHPQTHGRERGSLPPLRGKWITDLLYRTVTSDLPPVTGQTMKLLGIDSNPLGTDSISRELSLKVVAGWNARHPVTTVDYLDLAVDAPSHLDMDSLGFRLGPDAAELTAAQ